MFDKHQDGRVTFIFPNYNHAQFLPESLGNALNQTRPVDKLIIIDDASTDNSLKIIHEMSRNYPQVEIIQHEKNKGCLKTLCEGLDHTETEFVSFLAADDRLDTHYLEKYLPLLKKHSSAAFCSGSCQIINFESKTIGMRPFFPPSGKAGFIRSKKVKSLLKKCDNFLLGSGALYRRKFILDAGGFDTSLHFLTDGMLMRRLALEHGFCFIPEALASWRFLGDNSSVKTITDEKYLETLIQNSKTYIFQQKQGLFPENYANLLERRLRFGSARLQIIMATSFKAPQIRKIFSTLNSRFAEKFIGYLVPKIGLRVAKFFLLSYSFLATRPFKEASLVTAFLKKRY